MGFDFHTGATLADLQIVLHARPQGGTWIAAAPYFILLICWQLAVQAAAHVELVEGPDQGHAFA